MGAVLLHEGPHRQRAARLQRLQQAIPQPRTDPSAPQFRRHADGHPELPRMEVPREVADLTVAACSSGLAIHRDVPFQRILSAVEVRVFIAQLIRGPRPVGKNGVGHRDDGLVVSFLKWADLNIGAYLQAIHAQAPFERNKQIFIRPHQKMKRAQSSLHPAPPHAAFSRILQRASSCYCVIPMGAGPVHSRTVINNPDARLYCNHWAPPTLGNAKTVTYERWRSQLKSRCRVGDQGTREPTRRPAGVSSEMVPWYRGPFVPLC